VLDSLLLLRRGANVRPSRRDDDEQRKRKGGKRVTIPGSDPLRRRTQCALRRFISPGLDIFATSRQRGIVADPRDSYRGFLSILPPF